ncbi:hypothetical protein [Lentzea sp. NPDC060358]|uniref:hypothetical protein n=1 Tax=Lentzea sp. NPDC060358 TaxID=3347103 RepID=UPI003668280C
MVQGLTWTPGFGEGTELNDKFSGAGMVDTVAGLVKAVQEQDNASIAAYSVGLAFDIVGAALNPLGAVIGAGVGWLIDHIAFLREPLDLLIGDNIAIRQETEKLKDDAKNYEGLASGHLAALKKLDGWAGEAADRFRSTMAHVSKELEAIGSAVNASAKLMGTMGACVTAVRSLVRDIIAMVIGNLIGGALIAAGLAPITFGASIVAFIGTAVATALEALSRIMRHVTKLKSLITSSSKAADDLGTALAKMGDDAARFGKGGASSGASTPPPVKPPGDTPTINGGGGAGGAKPPAGDAPPVQKPPDVPGGPGGGGGGKPPAGDAPPVQKPPDVPGGPAGGAGGKGDAPEPPPVQKPPGDSTGTAGVKPPDTPSVKPPDMPAPPPPAVTKPPSDMPVPPPVPPAGGAKPPSGGGGAGGGKPPAGIKPDDLPKPPPPAVTKPPSDNPLPPGGTPKPDSPPPAVPKPDDAAPKPPATPKPDDAAPKPPATPKPDDAAPKPPGDSGAPKPPGDSGAPKPPGDSGAPKPPGSDAPGTPPKPDDAAPKPPGSDAPGAPGTGGGKPPFSWAEVKNHVDDLSKFGKQHLDEVLTTKFGKTPDEAAKISQWIKNFEELAAPGGHFTVAGKAFATGSVLHMVHELWKELGADKHGQKENEGFLGDLKEHNAQL